MANEIQHRAANTGDTLYATIRDAANEYWKTSEWEELTTWANYAIDLTEYPAGSYVYAGTFPAAIDAGLYRVDIYRMDGVSAAVDDTLLSAGEMNWDGEEEVNWATEAKQDVIDTVVDGIKVIADKLPNGGALTSLSTHTAEQAKADVSALATSEVLATAAATLVKLLTTLEADGGNFKFTVDALQGAPSGTGSTPAQFVTALKEAVLDGELTFEDAFKAFIAFARGDVTRDGNTWSFQDQAGGELFSFTVTSSGRTAS